MANNNANKLEIVKKLTEKTLSNMTANTPAIMQYIDAKRQYPDAVVLFRMGDFYELFFDDAEIASRELEITLTARGKNENKVPLAGIPYHALDNYLGKFVEKGYKIAICEQLEDPKLAKGVVKRGVTRVITPGTKPFDLVNANSNNYLMSIYQQGNYFAIAAVDLTTNNCSATIVNHNNMINEISKYDPSEIIMPESLKLNSELNDELSKLKYFFNPIDNDYYSCENPIEFNNIDSLDVDLPISISSKILNNVISSIAKYSKYMGIDSNIIKESKLYSVNNYMTIDRLSLKNLELLYNNYDYTNSFTLLSALDKTCTSMGLRFLKNVILRPLIDVKMIEKRLNAVEELKDNTMAREAIRFLLKQVYDIERLSVKLSQGKAQPKDLNALKKSLIKVKSIEKELMNFSSKLCKELNNFYNIQNVIDIVDSSISDENNYSISDRGYIKKGYDDELENVRKLLSNSKEILMDIEQKEKEKNHIPNLRISYNKVIGYHITISKSNLKLVPDYFIRKQTLVNAERFVTPELKALEEKILQAEQNIDSIELNLYNKIIEKLTQYIDDLLRCSRNISYLDVLQSLAETAYRYNYIKPEINELNITHIKSGRHPIIEQIEPNYTPNDLYLDKNNYIHIITGPNMSGKSTFMRQTILIQIMMQIGCFVPCDFASLSIVDKIFTRIGASDHIAKGESTFMVEMLETANILNNATSRSMIILDEIGRGTSTFDGIAIAHSVVEYLANKIKAKTLFATHYHQLNKLSDQYEFINNYNILVKEDADRIIFLHKIVAGGTDKSYGIHVAKLAGLPDEVVNNSLEIINKLEMKDNISDKVFGKFKDISDKDNKNNKKNTNRRTQSLLEFD